MTLDAIQMNPALLSHAAPVQPPAKDANMEHIEQTARDFEAMFVSEMLRPMFDTIKVDERFGGGRGEDIFRGFMRDEYAKTMAANQSLGIADQVKQELIEMQSRAANQGMAQNMQGQS